MPDPAEPTTKIHPPWTGQQIATLNAFQRSGAWHPFTCPRCRKPEPSLLAAYWDGWHCARDCGYTQDWAHAFMADRNAWTMHQFTVKQVSAEEERAATRRARQMAEESERSYGWFKSHAGGPTAAETMQYTTVPDELLPADAPCCGQPPCDGQCCKRTDAPLYLPREEIEAIYLFLGKALGRTTGEPPIDTEEAVDEEAALPILFWDESKGVDLTDGRATLQLMKGISIANFAPAGQLILQLPAAEILRRALGATIEQEDES